MIANYQNFYLVGVKGVGMTALAEILQDMGKNVRGSDVAEDFPTAKQLEEARLAIDDFTTTLPENTDCVIFSGANGGSNNPQVVAGKKRKLAVYSHAQALGEIFNQKQGVAVCGVGGKSSTSAMLTVICEQINQPQSYAVGVGEIIGLPRTGKWLSTSKYFVAEADEYVDDPAQTQLVKQQKQPITPRFSYLQPNLTICTNLRFDHPDVYDNFEHTKQTFADFFAQIKDGGSLIINGDDNDLFYMAKEVVLNKDTSLLTFGREKHCDLRLTKFENFAGYSVTTFIYEGKEYEFKLHLPGIFNAYNGLAALAATVKMGFDLRQCCSALAFYQSAKRRFEFLGEKNGVLYYDDYAHHPSEIASAITALSDWYPERRKVILFQAHTFTRTKSLFEEFVTSFAKAPEVLMTDIFPSAREAWDDSVTATALCSAIEKKYPAHLAINLHTNQEVAKWCKKNLLPKDVVLSLGAGDIYKFFELI